MVVDGGFTVALNVVELDKKDVGDQDQVKPVRPGPATEIKVGPQILTVSGGITGEHATGATVEDPG
jgi:hypothetical protein